ncbi:acyloxyacyl hydrolase [Weeksellaceae bacterium KMM 9724]|uniref:acyloxyacyl hydrolase n=1 Tax=Profundicola chukchiensis TaxID=2961959 RepID=UPI00243775B6|nr:acyloxyacyl hydrolase [Profundicola chukchiensis]MDG4949726.1 acyloxyacyl hydrolase [Profundicola chukchiensis]
MRNFYLIFILSLFNMVQAQNDIYVGVSYGTSDIFRKDDASHYNYKNTEFGVFAIKDFAWKSNADKSIKKHWFLQPKINYGQYTFLVDDHEQDIYRASLGGGIKFEKELRKLALHARFGLNAGYQSGYYQRLEKGVYFAEKLNLGLGFNLNPRMKSFIDIGAMHISNANFYPLNRGLEVFFIELGIQIPNKKIEKF